MSTAMNKKSTANESTSDEGYEECIGVVDPVLEASKLIISFLSVFYIASSFEFIQPNNLKNHNLNKSENIAIHAQKIWNMENVMQIP